MADPLSGKEYAAVAGALADRLRGNDHFGVGAIHGQHGDERPKQSQIDLAGDQVAQHLLVRPRGDQFNRGGQMATEPVCKGLVPLMLWEQVAFGHDTQAEGGG